MQAKTKYALSGTAAGLVNGLFGGGGGMVLVPLLNDWWAVWWADSCSAGSASHGCGDCSPPFCCTAA